MLSSEKQGVIHLLKITWPYLVVTSLYTIFIFLPHYSCFSAQHKHPEVFSWLNRLVQITIYISDYNPGNLIYFPGPVIDFIFFRI